MTDTAKNLIVNYMVLGNNIGNADIFDVIATLSQTHGDDIISVIIENKNKLRPIVTGEIPQFSEEKDVYKVLRVLVDSGLDNMTYEQVGSYLCPVGTKFDARRKYGETHYKFACQLGLTRQGRPLATTEIGVEYYLLENDEKRQELMNRLVFSIPFVQHSIIKANEGRFYMPDFLAEYLSPSTVLRRRSNMRKIMSWAYEITDGTYRKIFDNIAWY